MTRLIHRAFVVASLAATVSIACEDDGAPAGPGVTEASTVSLATPNPDDRAILLSVAGASLASVEIASHHRAFIGEHPDGDVRVALFGALEDGPLLRLAAGVPVEAAVVILEVAGPDGHLREDLSGYSVQRVPDEP